LRDPEIAAMFDKDGNGLGEYWAGDAGWASTKTWQVKFKSYGLSELWEPEILPDATFKALLESSVQREKPVLFYYWTLNGFTLLMISLRSKNQPGLKAVKT